ncbi:MAG: cell division protein FtsL [Betaproteobacteria bacterium]|nr:cell division protein FtsL [Betaproteobacteria bacterium]MBP6644905.1 cell division protein FtsL [Burkholderiaceae bacterium]
MTRLNLVLLLAVLASALYLVRTQYESRRLFVEYERAKAEAHRLDVEHDGLQIQQRAQATPLRVEKLAKEKLQMRTATPAITQYVTYSEPATASVGALSTDRPPVGAKAPPGGSAAREAANVGAISR